VIRSAFPEVRSRTGLGNGVDRVMASAQGFIELLEAFRPTGGTAPLEVLGRLLDERHGGHAVSLDRLIDTGQVFGFPWRASLWVPMFQFAEGDLAPHAGAQRVRAELPSAWSAWTVASWFATANTRLDGRNPAATIDSNLDAVVQAALSLELSPGYAPMWLRKASEVATHA